MKQINLFKNLLLVAFLFAAGLASAQVHPLSFGSYTLGGGATNPNWYSDYVGLRLEVVSPAPIAGNKAYTYAGGAASGAWGGVVTTPIVHTQVFMDTTADSFGCSAFSAAAAATMAGKIAVIWRGPLGTGACEFSCKAQFAQTAGAVAVVLVNEYPGQGPVGMALGSCTGVTIPVFMISNLDGIAISGQYRAGVPVYITITPWGQNLENDLGFVPNGEALWHSNVIPYDQLVGATSNPTAYNMLDGAFIANYGTHPATNVKLAATTSFIPYGGIATVQHSDTVRFEGPFYDDTASAHSLADSIMAMFGTASSAYSLTATGGAGGQFNITYNISSDSADQYPPDNTQTISFYLSDSVYCKGSYDFTTNQPTWQSYLTFGTTPPEFLWGPMYYISKANASTSIAGVQYSLAMAQGAANYPYLTSTSGNTFNNVYVFKWVDGLAGTPDSVADSFLEAGELELVALGTRQYNGTTDTSTVLLYASLMDVSGTQQYVPTGNSWYYVCVDVPDGLYLGVDGGTLNPYPRVYGIYNAYTGGSGDHLIDYSSATFLGSGAAFPEDSLAYYPTTGSAPIASGQTAYLTSIDSFVYSNMPGLIPNVALTLNKNYTGVKNVSTQPFANVALYPNPAKDVMNASVSFNQIEPTVSYEIIDGLAHIVSRETHTNVQNETYTVNTTRYAPGNYYLIINAEGKVMSKKFTILK